MIHPHSMSRRLVLVAVLLAAPLTACRHGESDPVGPGGVTLKPPVELGSRARGAVPSRYSAEVTWLDAGARGRFVYTSTWGRRGSGPCTASNCGNVVYV